MFTFQAPCEPDTQDRALEEPSASEGSHIQNRCFADATSEHAFPVVLNVQPAKEASKVCRAFFL